MFLLQGKWGRGNREWLVQQGKSKKSKGKRKNSDTTSLLAIPYGLFIYADLYYLMFISPFAVLTASAW
ncbi:hypothetical protein BCD64_18265 [Nostoc sp. MBR 210]|nr:hypothetical protein BCD64_18265 [Nostoc sp. MBR 210]